MKINLESLGLKDLKSITVLGIGAFGKVDLVQIKGLHNHSYALKKIRIQKKFDQKTLEHIDAEKQILVEVKCDFIIRLIKVFSKSSDVFLLMESCLGGELASHLREKISFDVISTQFYTACVVEALHYLHSHNIIYRDIKPQNLLLDHRGYLKLIDFGFAKQLIHQNDYILKTNTFCGTHEYMAPEIILGKDYDFAVDSWSLGILVFEMLTGTTPFIADSHQNTFSRILKGFRSIKFPKNVSTNSANLIKMLCEKYPENRINMFTIKRHKWFNNFKWDSLRKRLMLAPKIPKIACPLDSSNYF